MNFIKIYLYFVIFIFFSLSCSHSEEKKPKIVNECKLNFMMSNAQQIHNAEYDGFKKEHDELIKLFQDEKIDCETLKKFYATKFRKAINDKYQQIQDSIRNHENDKILNYFDSIHRVQDSILKECKNKSNRRTNEILKQLNESLKEFDSLTEEIK
jgi:hypothetical protein